MAGKGLEILRALPGARGHTPVSDSNRTGRTHAGQQLIGCFGPRGRGVDDISRSGTDVGPAEGRSIRPR
jgi:hypothetical protein